VKSKAVVLVSEQLKTFVQQYIAEHYSDSLLDIKKDLVTCQKLQRELSTMFTNVWHGEYLETVSVDVQVEDEDDEELAPFFAVLHKLDKELMDHYANHLVSLIIPMDLKGTVMVIITELEENEYHDNH
jgi:hypothetical protein